MLLLGAIGLICGIILTIASKLMAVPVDERLEAIRAILPNANCGACGYPGCDGFAKALAAGEAPVTGCPPGGAEVAEALSEMLGVEAGAVLRQRAAVRCSGCAENRKEKMTYVGALTCTYVSQLYGGPTACFYACQGLGDCIAACQFDAINVVNGLALIDPARCTSCMLCVATCPKGLIQMAPAGGAAIVSCSNLDRGAITRKACSVGCIGCSICVRECAAGAIVVENNLARVDYAKCIGCGDCVEACPQKTIYVN